MKYWVYIDNKVTGPFTTDKLVTLNGFTPDTLICSEDAANSGNQEWVKASTIFEFDEQPDSAATPTSAATPASEAAPAATGDSLVAALMAKLDAMASQLTGLQSKMDGVQTKLDESIATQQKTAQEAAQRAEALAEQVTQLSTPQLHQPVAGNEENAGPQLRADDSLPSVGASTNSSSQDPLDMGTPMDFMLPSENANEENPDENLLDKEGEDAAVLSSALDSLRNPKVQTEEEKESTFQDLLTPVQAAALVKEAQANQAKEEVLAEFTEAKKEADVVDQVIKEKEEDEAKKSVTLRWLSAGAAALAGAVGLKKKMDDNAAPEEKPANLEIASTDAVSQTPETTQPEEEKQALNFENPQGIPTLSSAPETAQAEQASPLPPDQPQPESNPTDEPALEPMGAPQELSASQPASEEEASGNLITDADLQDAFTERKSQEDASVEQLFGLASAGAAVAGADAAEQAAPEEPKEESKEENLPSLDQINAGTDAAEQAVPEDPQHKKGMEVTEIELKAGSTYLISDFVPPTLSPDDNREKTDLAENGQGVNNVKDAKQDDKVELQEFVTNPGINTTNATTPEDKSAESANEVTVSQIVLENAIKAKRGAALDIKTVPMVPEPAQSDRLQLDDINDINSQHDLKSADVEPAGKGVRMAVGVGAIVLLLGLIYAMLAFINVIPPQFNLLAKPQPTAQEQQDAQINEMLGDETLPVQTVDENTPGAESVSQEAILTEVKNYLLPNGTTLEQFIQAKHPAAGELITWEISTAVDPDNYSVLVKVPPENPQSFKTSYRFNYNTVTKALEPTISDAKNLLDSAQPQPVPAQ